MPTLFDPATAVALLHEAETRMVQALDNFFQRNRNEIQDAILRAIATQATSSTLANGQICLDWLNACPDRLSTSFAEQYRQLLARPDGFAGQAASQSAQLQLVDDAVLGRQLTAEKMAARLTDTLRPELLQLSGRLQFLIHHAPGELESAQTFGPLPVIHALSRALNALELNPQSGTLFIQSAANPLGDTLKHTYTALNQFLGEHGVEEHTAVRTLPESRPRPAESAVGQDILAHIEAMAAQDQATRSTAARAAETAGVSPGNEALSALLPRFLDSLAHWQNQPILIPDAATAPAAQLLRKLQQDARLTDAGSFDLAVLDTLAGLFEFILDDPDISPRYKSTLAQLQIPTLRAALESAEFFNNDHHPARQLIDLLGQFSRRFPDSHPACADAQVQIEAACTPVIRKHVNPTGEFAQAHRTLNAWLDEENARAEIALTAEVAQLQQIENHELGTLLALQNLHDLTLRLPAPEAVLRRLEAAWIPHMASLYVAESGEGANWRDACATLLMLFQSLQTPSPDAREARLQSIPAINTALRRGLLAQGAEPLELKDFFSAITRAQECWIRPDLGSPVDESSAVASQPVSASGIESLARQLTAPAQDDPILQQTRQLIEGDWVDFDPPFEGLVTARVAWVGVQGYLLFCDDAEAQRFSLDCAQLATEIRAGRARIPEQSLTRKAMLRLETQLSGSEA